MIRIGITGGIGSGKSVVASLLRLSGVPVYIADKESKRLTCESAFIRERLTALLGANLYPEGKLDTRMLASYIFNDPERRRQVNGIIHPEVRRDFQTWAARQTAPLCAIESAILFESAFDREVDASLMVYAPRTIRVERAIRRDCASREEIERRIRSQMPDEEKRDKADFVILNDRRQALIPQVEALIKRLLP